MKFLASAFFLLSIGGLATSQTSPLSQPTADIDAQRVAIAAERNRMEAGFLSEDAVCYKNFAINRCLEGVNVRRMSAMENLRKLEVQLNDEQRKIKGAEQIRRIQEKSSPENVQQDTERRNKALEDSRDRSGRQQENVQRRAAAVAHEAGARKSTTDRLQIYERKTQDRAEKQANAVEEEKKFRQRQIQAQERRVRNETERANRGKSVAKPLPLPQ